MGFSLLQIIYWIALSTWFGGVLFIAIAAPIIFRTVRESNPILPTVLSVNLEGQHSSLLGGTIVANLIAQLFYIELVCAGGLLSGLVGQWFLSDISGQNWLIQVIRSAMFLAALGFVLFDWLAVWPKIRKHRDEYIEHADEPDIANPANEQFNRYQRDSETLLRIRLALLLALVLFSATIAPRRIHVPLPSGQASRSATEHTEYTEAVSVTSVPSVAELAS